MPMGLIQVARQREPMVGKGERRDHLREDVPQSSQRRLPATRKRGVLYEQKYRPAFAANCALSAMAYCQPEHD
jgi:hypothetical protein